MTFSFWSLDFIYYPVSGIMWIWHKVFGFLFGVFGAENPYSNAWAWVLSVMFLVFTLRVIMFKPFMKQMDSSLAMQALQPEMKKLREKYKDDRQRLTEEMMKLNKEAGVNPLASCLPALLQAPAFIGLFHVLRNFINAFNPSLANPKLPSTAINNYFFPASDVTSFHDAVLFGGASLSAHLTMPATSADPAVTSLAALNSTRETMLWVGIPLMILAAVATHLSSRKSIARQAQTGTAATGQMAIMQKLMLYVFPAGVLFIGAFYPLALLFYWLANNFWTFGQLAVAHRIQDRKRVEEEKVVDAAKERTTFSTPRPGARPKGPKRPVIQPSPVQRNGAEGADSSPDAGTGTDAAAAASDAALPDRGAPDPAGAGGTRTSGSARSRAKQTKIDEADKTNKPGKASTPTSAGGAGGTPRGDGQPVGGEEGAPRGDRPGSTGAGSTGAGRSGAAKSGAKSGARSGTRSGKKKSGRR